MKWFSGREFGFINIDNEDDDIFFHTSNLQDHHLRTPENLVGMRVNFIVKNDEKGRRQAVGVKSIFYEG